MTKVFTVDKEFILQAHKEACGEWKTKLEDKFPDAFQPQLEAKVNTWYKIDNRLFYTTKIIENVHYGYSIENEIWVDYTDTTQSVCACNNTHFKYRAKYATDKEVEEALIKEAKKRGLVKGIQVKCLYDKKLYFADSGQYQYDDNELWLDDGNILIFSKGKWAKAIENETQKKIEELQRQLDELKQIL